MSPEELLQQIATDVHYIRGSVLAIGGWLIGTWLLKWARR